MAIVGLWSFSCMTLRIDFDPTQCACAHDMSNRLIHVRVIENVCRHKWSVPSLCRRLSYFLRPHSCLKREVLNGRPNDISTFVWTDISSYFSISNYFSYFQLCFIFVSSKLFRRWTPSPFVFYLDVTTCLYPTLSLHSCLPDIDNASSPNIH